MRRIPFLIQLLGAATLLAAAPACKKKENTDTVTTTGSAGSAGSAAMTGSGSAAMTDTGSAGSAGAMAGSGSGSADMAGSAAAPTPGLTDPKIAAIVVAANQVDIDAGNLAIKKAKDPEVKKFAERMVTDHTAVNKAATDLVTKLKVTPEESDTSKSLTSGGKDMRAKLEKLSGAEFDKAYVDNEVAYHTAVIDVVANQLIPSAQNKELKDALVGAAPAFQAHLEHAKKIQETLNKGGTAGSAAAGSAAAGSGMGSGHSH